MENNTGSNIGIRGQTKINWEALDKYWAEEYEEDYGKLFSKSVVISEYP